MEVVPSLTLEEARYLSNETMDALVTAAQVRQRIETLSRMEGASASQANATVIQGQIEGMRSGVKDIQVIIERHAMARSLDGKFGTPVLDTSDSGLAAIGLQHEEG